MTQPAAPATYTFPNSGPLAELLRTHPCVKADDRLEGLVYLVSLVFARTTKTREEIMLELKNTIFTNPESEIDVMSPAAQTSTLNLTDALQECANR
jgi:hypothetical protein